MKRILCFLIIVITITLFALDESKTIEFSDFTTIKYGCENDDLINHYYYQIFNSREDSEIIFDERGRAETFQTNDYIKKALVGAIGVGLSGPDATVLLNEAYNFILNPITDPYLSIANDVIPYLAEIPDPVTGVPSASRKSLDAGYMLENLALIVDMLWWYDGGQHQPQLTAKLDSLASFIQRRQYHTRGRGLEADSTNADYVNAGYTGGISDVYPGISADTIVWPSFSHTNYRLTGLGALGYAGVVLGPNYGNQFDYDNYLDFVDYELDIINGAISCVKSFNEDHDPVYGNVYINGPGYINHNLHSSGLYAEGISYMSQIMNNMSLYFTARNRYDGINYYDIFVEQMLEETIPLITPDFGYVCFDDSYYVNSLGKLIFPVGYYQWLQQDSQGGELENSIQWYADNYKTENSFDYLVPAWSREAKLQSILSYSNTSLTGGTIPDVISQGSYSNNDYTVLRSEISDEIEFQEQSAMWITHNEGLSYSGHEQGDQSSFVLWYKGQQLITDQGYFSGVYADNHVWCNSSFAHNVIQVENTSHNLDYTFEDTSPYLDVWDIIGEIEPFGMHYIYQNPADTTRNPINKSYQYVNNDISSLKVNLKYYNTQNGHRIGSEKLDLFRYFYRVGENIYLIYDDMQRLESEPGTIDMANQLHFEAYASSDQNLTSFSNGKFELTNNGTNVNLFGTMGSLHNPETGFPEIKENLPFGQYRNNGNNDYAHRAMRLKTRTNENEKFLTLLFPSEEADSPIYYVYNQDEKYGVTFNIDNVYQGNQGEVVTGITTGEGISQIPHYCTQIKTDAEFYQVAFWNEPMDANVGYVKSFIANKGTQLSFWNVEFLENLVIFESFDGNYEEVSASYEDDVCYLSLIPEEGSSPRCKIWRNEGCTTLDDEYISTHDFIAYDENYFYIDYDQNELPSSGITITDIINENINIYSTYELSNALIGCDINIVVHEGGSLLIDGINRFGDNSKIDVYGSLTLYSASLLANEESWEGIKLHSEGQIEFIKVSEDIIPTVRKANYGIYATGGNISISESLFDECDYAIKMYDYATLSLNSSTIRVPEDGVGISISNNYNECDISITGDAELGNTVIQSIGNQSGTGISFGSEYNNLDHKFSCSNTTFSNLTEGIHYATRIKSDDEIISCIFNDCETGLGIYGSGALDKISKSDFNSCIEGIYLNTAKCFITLCDFINCGGSQSSGIFEGAGVVFDNTTGGRIDGPQTQTSSLFDCTFSGSGAGVKCINATPRITNCTFSLDLGNWGIEVHNKSYVDLSWASNNVFSSTNIFHIIFYNSGSINILKGHNDFYAGGTNWDFIFAPGYEVPSNPLDCNYNYWSDRPLGEGVPYTDYINIVNEPDDFIIAEFSRMDDYPNVTFNGETENRFEEAGLLESEGNPEVALSLYESILVDQLEEETSFWKNCVDRVFILSLQLEENFNNLLLFYDTFIVNIPQFVPLEEKEELIVFVKNYQKKVQIEIKNYQEAADIVVERIEDPSSPVDALFAVMELENIYYLASLENGRANVSTSFEQHKPENVKQLHQWYGEHWQELNKLLGSEDDFNNVTIPLEATLYNNYPNPFNPETKISFSIPADSKVRITIYNIKGQKVKTLINENLVKGIHDVIWRSKNNSGKSVASGVYFYQFDVNGKTKGLNKMLLLK